MAKYRKKPVVIEAFQLTWDFIKSVNAPSWVIKNRTIKFFYTDKIENSQYALIDTLEGQMRANANDWIIEGVNGEIYPCKPDIFEKTYELVEE